MGSVESLLGIKWISQYGLLDWRVGNQREMGCVEGKEAEHPPEGRNGAERSGHIERLQEQTKMRQIKPPQSLFSTQASVHPSSQQALSTAHVTLSTHAGASENI